MHSGGRRRGELRRGSQAGALGRFGGALRDVGGPVDHLQVRRAPEGEKVGPGKVLAIAPHLEQRHAVVDLGAAQEPPPGRRAAALLDAFEQAELVARRVPELPRRDAGRVPLPAARAAGAGEITVPAEAEHWLAADGAMPLPPGKARVAVRRRRRPEALALAAVPALRRAA